MLRIAVIIGSTRPGRNGEAVAKWVYEIAQKRSDAAVRTRGHQRLQPATPRRTGAAVHGAIQ
jgi:NAD(P)H-dependent FMN reductase